MKTIKAVALLIIAIIYLAGGYGLVTNLLPMTAAWVTVIAAGFYSLFFAGVFYYIYELNE